MKILKKIYNWIFNQYLEFPLKSPYNNKVRWFKIKYNSTKQIYGLVGSGIAYQSIIIVQGIHRTPATSLGLIFPISSDYNTHIINGNTELEQYVHKSYNI